LRLKRIGGPGKGWSKGKQYVPRRVCELCGDEFYAPPSGVKRGQHKYCSNQCRGWVVGNDPSRFGKPTPKRGIGGVRKDLGRYFRSSWEANWARYLNWLKENGQIKDWEYETETYEFEGIKRGSRFYTPDFIVTENDGTITRYEVKGWMDQRSQTKLKRMKKYHPAIKITVIDRKAYMAVAKKIAACIPAWEHPVKKPTKSAA
jgi:hypothetical protein